MEKFMSFDPTYLGCVVLLLFCFITTFASVIFKYFKLKNETFSKLRHQSHRIQKLYHSVYELEELIEILIEELDDKSLSLHHQEQKNRIKKQFTLNAGQV
jgi:predicted DNA-binding protein